VSALQEFRRRKGMMTKEESEEYDRKMGQKSPPGRNLEHAGPNRSLIIRRPRRCKTYIDIDKDQFTFDTSFDSSPI
jgi:hypothetical protein